MSRSRLRRPSAPRLQTAGEHDFDWHHTAVMGYLLADMPERLDAPGGGRR